MACSRLNAKVFVVLSIFLCLGYASGFKFTKCPSLFHPHNGEVKVTNVFIGSIAKYSCDTGFKLVGPRVRTCFLSGIWSKSQPTCKRISSKTTCPVLDAPSYGSVHLSGNNPGDKATYSCNDGFKLVGSKKRKCLPNGEWAGRAPTCRAHCSDLVDPSSGKVRLSGRNPGDKATYSCKKGFRLVGDSVRECQDNGHWSGSAPICQRLVITCSDLVNPISGKVRLSGRNPGDKATYSCKKGFRLVGHSVRECQDNGHWSGSAPICQIVTACPALESPENGNVVFNGVSPSSIADYSCDKGFKLVGNSWRRCLPSGEWSGEAPTCKSIDCGVPPNPVYGYVKYWTTTPGSKAIHGCYTGYHLIGNRVRSCSSDGHWSGKTPVCQRSYADNNDESSSSSSH